LASVGPAGNDGLSSLLKEYMHYSAGKTLFTELRHLSDASYVRPVLKQKGFIYEDHLFHFRYAKQYWGLEDFMNVKKTAVTNAANLAFSWSMSARLCCRPSAKTSRLFHFGFEIPFQRLSLSQ
jgi:hypothetical protein